MWCRTSGKTALGQEGCRSENGLHQSFICVQKGYYYYFILFRALFSAKQKKAMNRSAILEKKTLMLYFFSRKHMYALVRTTLDIE